MCVHLILCASIRGHTRRRRHSIKLGDILCTLPIVALCNSLREKYTFHSHTYLYTWYEADKSAGFFVPLSSSSSLLLSSVTRTRQERAAYTIDCLRQSMWRSVSIRRRRDNCSMYVCVFQQHTHIHRCMYSIVHSLERERERTHKFEQLELAGFVLHLSVRSALFARILKRATLKSKLSTVAKQANKRANE